MKLLFLTLSVLSTQATWCPVQANRYKKKTSYSVPYQWNKLEFGFPDEQTKQQAIADGNLLPVNATLIDVQPHPISGRTFVTVPRFQAGIPYSLAIVSNKKGKDGNILLPYPSYEANNNRNGRNCDAITSAFRVAITECNQMWVIDTGSVYFEWQCPPQLILFDLNTDQIIHRYRFNTSVYTPGASLFNIPLVNVKNPAPNGDCSNTVIYVSDVKNHGLVVYDYKQNNSWRIENRYMYPHPDHGLLTIAGDSIILMDGLFGMATDKKHLYFHTLASVTEYVVPLCVIENGTLFARNIANRPQDFKILGKRASQCGASAMDKNNNLYCVNFNPVRLTVWNVHKTYNTRNIKSLNVDPKVLEFVSGMKVVTNANGQEELWMLSNREQTMNVLLLTLCVLITSPNNAYGTKTQEQIPFTNGLKTPYRWKLLEFNFLNEQLRQQAKDSNNLLPMNAIPIDVQPYYYNKNRLRTFVTIPRFQSGIPFTLATISNQMEWGGPLLEPYPNYETHDNNKGRNCDAISSAFRVAINECNQMWVIDSGLFDKDVHCPPQLLLFDLNTDQLIHRFRFPASVYTPGASLFITPITDVRDPPPRGSCRRTMVYVADVTYHGLVVYDFMQDKAWRVENIFMYPEPKYGLHSVAGDKFVLMDGIFGMATDKENLYFHPLASATEFAVPLNIIDNSTLFENNVNNMYEAFRPLGTRSSECAASAMDSNNNLYCVTLNPIELIVWNVNTPYDANNIKKLPINSEELEFVSGMKVIRNHEGNEELWMMSNRFQKLAVGNQDFNEVNFRVVVRPLANVSPSSPEDGLQNKLVFKN